MAHPPSQATGRAALSPRVLSTLVAVAKSGSFQSAAVSENLTLSAVSMQMKGLEQALDAELFDRTNRPPQLTPLGRLIASRAVDVLTLQDGIIDACHAPGSTLRGRFRIGFVLTATVRLLPRFLAQSQTDVPQSHFDIATGLSDELKAQVEAKTLDAAIITASDDDVGSGALRATTLTREPLVYCLPKQLAATPSTVCFDTMPFLHFTPDTGIGRLIARYLQANNLEPTSVITLDTVEAIAECVRANVGFAILPEPDVARYSGDRIALRPLDQMASVDSHVGPALTRRLVLITRENTPLDRERSAIKDMLVTNSECASHDDGDD